MSSKSQEVTDYPPMLVVHLWWRWALRARIGMTIKLPGHPMSVTQCYLAMTDKHVIRVV